MQNYNKRCRRLPTLYIWGNSYRVLFSQYFLSPR